jgi:hypothetical protein
MNDVTPNLPNAPVVLPAPRCAVRIRPGVMGDLPFIDSLQRMHAKQVGWMPTKQLEGKIGRGHVIVAEEVPHPGPLPEGEGAKPVGYCIGHDRAEILGVRSDGLKRVRSQAHEREEREAHSRAGGGA